MNGKVYLVGAGPGDPGLATVKAIKLIREADVLVYDRLVGKELIKQAKADAELIYVGKESNRHTMAQDEINQVLADKAKEGKMVVRLKGGDPNVFGRGAEEALYVRERGVEFEFVPGITSAIGAPTYAGIPVTHRDCTSTLAIITGHEKPDKGESAIAWDKISTGAGTLIFLMGVENLPYIVQQLMDNGRSGETPIALVRWGTLPEQEVVTGTLDSIVEIVKAKQWKPPSVIIVGEVVALRDQLRWFDQKPLWGKTVAVTRSRTQASALSSRLEELGARVIELPTIRIEPLPTPDFGKYIEKIGEYAWMIFTSVNGVDIFFDKMQADKLDIRDLKGPKIAAIGPTTAAALTQRGLLVDVVPEEYRAEAIAETMRSRIQGGQQVLIPRARGAREVLPDILRGWNVTVDELHLYQAIAETSVTPVDKQMLTDGQIDLITFTSSSTVTNFIKVMGEKDARKAAAQCRIACIGPVTAETAVNNGFTVDITPKDYTISGLVDAIFAYYVNK